MKLKSDHINSSLLSPALMSTFEQSYLDELFKVQEQVARALYMSFLRQHGLIFKVICPYMLIGWHIKAIAEHLEAVYTRQIRKLIINASCQLMCARS